MGLEPPPPYLSAWIPINSLEDADAAHSQSNKSSKKQRKTAKDRLYSRVHVQQHNDAPVVVKHLRGSALLRWDASDKCAAERATACANVQSSAIIRTVGVGASGHEAPRASPLPSDDLFVVESAVPPGTSTAAVPAVTLRDLLLLQMSSGAKRLCRTEDALRWGYQVTRGLWDLHRAGLAHGDVRAGTVPLLGMPSTGGRDVARATHTADAALSDVCVGALMNLQGRAEAVLNPAPGNAGSGGDDDDLVVYVAPEVLAGTNQQGQAADVYSLGVLLGDLLSWQLSYVALTSRIEGLDLPAYMSKVVHEGARPPLPDSVPPKLQQLVNECWAAEPSARPSSAEVLLRLDTHLRSTLAPATSTPSGATNGDSNGNGNLQDSASSSISASGAHSTSEGRNAPAWLLGPYELEGLKAEVAAHSRNLVHDSSTSMGRLGTLSANALSTVPSSHGSSPHNSSRGDSSLHGAANGANGGSSSGSGALAAGLNLARSSMRHFSVEQTNAAFQRFTAAHWVRPEQLEMMGRGARANLGQGAYAGVMRAQLRTAVGGSGTAGARMDVAVKKLKAEALCEQSLKDFMWECALLCKLHHPSIARVIGAGSTQEFPCDGTLPTSLYLVQEFLEGGDLRALLTKQMATPTHRLYKERDALRWALQMARGLRALHTANPMIIHRDLKPDNVLLTGKRLNRANAKIADFGLHVLVRKEMEELRAASDALLEAAGPGRGLYTTMSTDATVLVPGFQEYGIRPGTKAAYQLTGLTGSLLYMAPEVYRHEEYNEKVDVYSFGVILFELLTHELAFYALNARHDTIDVEAYVEGVCRHGWRPDIPARVPVDLAAIIKACWAHDPASRPPMIRVVALLKEAMDARGLPTAPERITPSAAGPMGRQDSGMGPVAGPLRHLPSLVEGDDPCVGSGASGTAGQGQAGDAGAMVGVEANYAGPTVSHAKGQMAAPVSANGGNRATAGAKPAAAAGCCIVM